MLNTYATILKKIHVSFIVNFSFSLIYSNTKKKKNIKTLFRDQSFMTLKRFIDLEIFLLSRIVTLS